MMKYHILLIDDDFEYSKRVISDSKAQPVELTVANNLEDGFAALDKNKIIKAVILDDLCILKRGQNPETGKSNFIFLALQKIRNMFYEKRRDLVYCINAVDPAIFTDSMDGVANVFKKDIQHHEMFAYLIGEIQKFPETQIRKEYKSIYSNLSLIFDQTQESLLTEILCDMHLQNRESIMKTLHNIRILEEALIDFSCSYFLKQSPTSFEGEGNRTKNIITVLKNRDIISVTHSGLAREIYSACSEWGSHTHYRDKLYIPTHYRVKSVAFVFLELLEHLKGKIIR